MGEREAKREVYSGYSWLCEIQAALCLRAGTSGCPSVIPVSLLVSSSAPVSPP